MDPQKKMKGRTTSRFPSSGRLGNGLCAVVRRLNTPKKGWRFLSRQVLSKAPKGPAEKGAKMAVTEGEAAVVQYRPSE